MAIQSIDQYLAAKKQRVLLAAYPGRTTGAGANTFFGIRDISVQPGALASLASPNADPGALVSGGSRNFPALNTFQAGAKGYLSRFNVNSYDAVCVMVVDRLYDVGPLSLTGTAATFSLNGGVVSGIPNVLSRIPNGDASGCFIALEGLTLASGNAAWNATYTNESGVAGRSTGNVQTTLQIGRMFLLPLANGDSGVQRLESVTCTANITAQFNAGIFRPIFVDFVPGIAAVRDLFETGLPELHQSSALELWVAETSTTNPRHIEATLEIANG